MKQTQVIVLNAAFRISEDQAAQLAPPKLWARIAPAFGEKSASTPNGEIVNQRFSTESNARVVANFEPEVLVDREHNSVLTGDTTAYAWISELRSDADGLHAAFNATDIGWDALKNRRLRFPSAVFELDQDGYPQRLLSVGLTNRHNLKDLAPILNKDAGAGAAAPSAASNIASATPTPTQGEQPMDKALLVLLGLAENADAPTVLNKVKEVLARVDSLSAELKTLHTAALNKEADDFVKANAAKIKESDRDKIKAQYVLNKEVVTAVVAAMPDIPAQQHQRFDRADGKAPNGATALNAEADAQKAARRDAVVRQIAREDGCGYVQALNKARNDPAHKDLF